MKKLLSLSLMLSIGLATVTPALNAAQSKQTVAQSQANPAHASGWQAAKKWWRSGRKMNALNPQEQRAFRTLRTKFTIGAIIAAIVGGAALAIGYKKQQAEQEAPTYVDAVPYIVSVPYVDAVPYAAPPSARPTRATGPVVAPAMAARLELEQELINAAERGDENRVEELLKEKGINVNATDRLGSTALMMAAGEGHAAIVKLLLQARANVNFADSEGATALMIAAQDGHKNAVKELLKAKDIDVNAATQFRNTALMAAVEGGHKDTVELLLKAGADRTMKNEHEQTAEDIAVENKDDIITNMIRDYRSGIKFAGKTG